MYKGDDTDRSNPCSITYQTKINCPAEQVNLNNKDDIQRKVATQSTSINTPDWRL